MAGCAKGRASTGTILLALRAVSKKSDPDLLLHLSPDFFVVGSAFAAAVLGPVNPKDCQPLASIGSLSWPRDTNDAPR